MKKRDMAQPREEHGSVPPPPRRRRERHELDPENLWDKETDDAEELESEEEGGEDGDFDEEAQEENGSYEDLDDWDHPVRRLKIN